jgi:hypothetical protein
LASGTKNGETLTLVQGAIESGSFNVPPPANPPTIMVLIGAQVLLCASTRG